MDANTQLINRLKLGLLLKSVREEVGQSQRDAALRVGYAKPTFVCNVEKGTTNIPINKVADFAREYGGAERNEWELAIIKMVHPDVWEICSTVFAKAYGLNSDPTELSKRVDAWVKKQVKKYNVDL